MTAALYDDVVTTPPAPRLTLAPAPKQASKRLQQPSIGAGSDPVVDATARLLSIPLRHAYAALWRMGLIDVR